MLVTYAISSYFTLEHLRTDTFFKGDNSGKTFSLHLLEKGSTFKGKTSLGKEFFPLNPSLEGTWCAGKQTGSHKSCPPCQKIVSSTEC